MILRILLCALVAMPLYPVESACMKAKRKHERSFQLEDLRPGAREADYRDPGKHRDPFQALVTGILAESARTHAVSKTLAAQAESLGFSLSKLDYRGEILWSLREQPDQLRGAGTYVFRPMAGTSSPLIVQAPHGYHDEGTAALAARLFESLPDATALYLNTVHRYAKEVTDEHAVRFPSDAAHNDAGWFHMATVAAAKHLPQTTVLQVHGYAGQEGEAAAVVSAGDTANAPDFLVAYAEALKRLWGPEVRVKTFPDEINKLGATQNVQGRLINGTGSGRFIHVELSKTLRERLLKDAGTMRAWRKATELLIRGNHK